MISCIYKSDGKCPFCGFKAGSAKGIQTHCFRFHSDQFQLKIVETLRGSIRIHAEPRHREKEQELGDEPGVHFVRRRAKHSAKPQRCRRLDVTSETMHQHMETPPPAAAAAAEAPRPKRLYYHSRSRLPMHPHQFQTDSDDESNAWLDEWGEAGISQFSDVTVAEKKFCNLWNRFSRPVTVIADTDTYNKFLEFIRLNIDNLKGLRLQLLKHVMTFWEHKRLSRDQMLACMMEYDKLQKQKTGDK